MTSRKLFAGVVTAVSGAIAVMAGCVDQDPIVTGHRSDAGSPTDASNTADVVAPEIINPVVPLDDYPAGDADDPRCRHCSTTLDTSKPRGTLCRYNDSDGGSKSSAQRLNELVQCACYEKCGSVCGNYCSGGKNVSICQLCISKDCSAQVEACLLDGPGGG